MPKFSFDIDKVLLTRLAEDNLPDLVNFDCGDIEMNQFLKEEAFDEQAKGLNSTTLLYYQNYHDNSSQSPNIKSYCSGTNFWYPLHGQKVNSPKYNCC